MRAAFVQGWESSTGFRRKVSSPGDYTEEDLCFYAGWYARKYGELTTLPPEGSPAETVGRVFAHAMQWFESPDPQGRDDWDILQECVPWGTVVQTLEDHPGVSIERALEVVHRDLVREMTFLEW